jgi:HEPN domain-containing protein
MSGRDQELENDRRNEAGRWLAVAIVDIRVVHLCLGADEPMLGIAAYHCQQAAEKAVKGMLVMADIAFAKTHDMARLGGLAASHYPDWRHMLAEMGRLTVWGHAYRYPGLEEVAEPEPSSDTLLAALATIGQLIDHLRELIASSSEA